jgi:mono/diheme cytochrome c family protein
MSFMIMSTGVAADELLGDPTAGRRLAENVCSACHIIALGETSTTESDAPAFHDLANTPRVTALSLRVFLQTPHERMPDLRLDRDETDNVIAYILSLEE